MTVMRMIAVASIAGLLAAAPFGFAQGATVHDHSHGAPAGKVKPRAVKKKAPAQHGHMRMSGMKDGMMQGGQAGRMGRAGMMQCPMMAANAATAPMHSLRMQWHHGMMMWHRRMMHSGS